jgi:hypothetical protein
MSLEELSGVPLETFPNRKKSAPLIRTWLWMWKTSELFLVEELERRVPSVERKVV